MIVETERLILRMFMDTDYDDLYECLKQLEDDEFEGYPGITYDNGKKHLAYRVGSDEFYAIELKENGKVIGNIYCGKRDFEAREVGYIINKKYQKSGYASEALYAVMCECFKAGVHRIFAECDPRNISSWKLLEKIGMTREAFLQKNIYFHKDENGNPIWKDTYIYACLNEQKV